MYSKQQAANRQRKFDMGICRDCTLPLVPGHKYCERHLEVRRVGSRERRAKRYESGLCVKCGVAPHDAGLYCIACWAINVSVNTCKSGRLQIPLIDLLESQRYRCVYSGRVLMPAVNAEIDHVIPKSQGGTDDIENLQWVDSQINRMKTDMSHDQFVAMCRFIAERLLHAGIVDAGPRNPVEIHLQAHTL